MNHPHRQQEADSFFAARCYRHPDRETNVSCTRCERPICPDCLRDAPVGFQCPDCVRARASARTPTLPYGGRIVERTGLVTIVLGVLNVVTFLVTAVTSPTGFNHNQSSRLFSRLVLSPFLVAHNDQYYRFIGSAFLHYGPVHLIVNMISLAMLGPVMEQRFGQARFLVLYLVSAIGGAVAVYAFDHTGADVAGASAAIFGLFGALAVVIVKQKMDLRVLIPTVLINVYVTLYVPGISWIGHLGGLVAGALVAAALVYAPRTNRLVYQLCGVSVVLALLAGLTIWRTMALT